MRQGGRKKAAKPYLWNIFLKIGGSSITISDSFKIIGNAVYRFSEGSHGNLNAREIMPGEVISIPRETGEWQTNLRPMILPYFEAHIPGVVACLSVLMNEGNISSKGAEAGHQFLNEFVETAVNNTLRDFDPKKIDLHDLENSVKNYFERRVLHYTEGLEGKMARIIMRSQNILQNIWTLLDKDDMIGFQIINFSHDLLETQTDPIPFVIPFNSEDFGTWELKGDLSRSYLKQETVENEPETVKK